MRIKNWRELWFWNKKVSQNRLLWYGHLLRKEDDDWVKKCMVYEVVGPNQEEDQRGPRERLYERTVKHVK